VGDNGFRFHIIEVIIIAWDRSAGQNFILLLRFVSYYSRY